MAAKPATKSGVDARVAIVRAEGDVSRAALEACDYAISSAGDVAGAVVDLSLATHVEFKAAVILVARGRVLKAKGKQLAVAAGLSDVRHMLRAATGNELAIFPTAEEALSYVRGEMPVAVAGTKVSVKAELPRRPGATKVSR